MGINGPNSSGNYQQPDVTAHPVAAQVASYPTGTNILGVSWPLTPHVESGAPPFPSITGITPPPQGEGILG
jgi:hypothetical protein